jgi:hypothetical protein
MLANNKFIQILGAYLIWLIPAYGDQSDEVFYAQFKWSDLVEKSKLIDIGKNSFYGGEVLDVSKVIESYGVAINKDDSYYYFVENGILYVKCDDIKIKNIQSLFEKKLTKSEVYRVKLFSSLNEVVEGKPEGKLDDKLLFDSFSLSGSIVRYGGANENRFLDIGVTKGMHDNEMVQYELSAKGFVHIQGNEVSIDYSGKLELSDSSKVSTMKIGKFGELYLYCEVGLQSTILHSPTMLDLTGALKKEFLDSIRKGK